MSAKSGKSGKNQGNASRLKNIWEKSGKSAKPGENQGKIREIMYLQKCEKSVGTTELHYSTKKREHCFSILKAFSKNEF